MRWLHYESADFPHVARLIKADFQSESAVKPDTVGRLDGNTAGLQRHQRNTKCSGRVQLKLHNFQMQQGLTYQANTSPMLLLKPCSLLFNSFSLFWVALNHYKMLPRWEALINLFLFFFFFLLTPVQKSIFLTNYRWSTLFRGHNFDTTTNLID